VGARSAEQVSTSGYTRFCCSLHQSTVPSYLIGAICLEAGAAIYHNDRDYDALAKVSPLTIHRPA